MKNSETEPLLVVGSRKGGFRTIPFIIANEAFEKVASFGLIANMLMYLMNEYHLDMASASNLLFIWSAFTNFFPVVGAYFADSSVGRFRMIAYGSIFSLSGTVLLWLTTMIPQIKPPPCVISVSNIICLGPTFCQLVFLCTSFLLMSAGAGGIRSASVAFGAEQLEDSDTLKQAGAMETYLGWYNAMTALSVVIAITFIVYIQEKFGWRVGFGVPAILMLISAVSFFMASSLYRNTKTNKSSVMTGLVQVVVASRRKRHVVLTTISDGNSNLLYHRRKESELVIPSDKLSFLNKACVIEDPENDLTVDGRASNPWKLCTIDQVEDLKRLISLIPLWSTGILLTVNLSQNTFPILQVNSMDRRIGPNFEIPAASFTVFMIISMVAWIVIYDRVLIPIASKISGKPARLSPVTRIGLGLCFSFLSMVVRASVETARRSLAEELGIVDDPTAILPMSALWLLPQNVLMGVAEAFNVVGQTELYMSELPRDMASLSSCLSGIGGGIGGIVASLLMNGIDLVSKRGGNESWISSNINKGHYDYYCRVLAGVSLVNLGYFLICSRAYGSPKGRVIKKEDSKNFNQEESVPKCQGDAN